MRAARRSAEWIASALTLREFERKLNASRVRRSMTLGTKPVIFISYAHLDEPEKPAEGEVDGFRSCSGTFGRPSGRVRSTSGSTH